MAYIHFNPNPSGRSVGDCVIRGISKLTGDSWETVYVGIVSHGFNVHDMPSSNAVWGEYLKRQGYRRYTCPSCGTVEDFAMEHPKGAYLACTGSHVVAVVDGDYYDAWDSGYETVTYYFKEG